MDRIEDVNAPKTLDFGIPDEVVLAFLGFLSGIFSTTLSYVLFEAIGDPQLRDAGLYLAPGAWFAVAVMLPFRKLVTYWWPRTILAIAVCACAHALAFDLTTVTIRANAKLPAWKILLWIMTVGAMGAFICGKGVLILLGRPWRYQILALMMTAGALLMLFFSLAYFIYPIWQAAVAAPLGGLRRELRAERTKQELVA